MDFDCTRVNYMKQMPLTVSVVIPVYNEEKYLGACLDSLMKQSDPPDEIIVVNNNSKDNSIKIAQQFPVRIIHEKKQGMTPARNRGFNEANYEIIARTDADTIVPPDWIKKIRRYFSDSHIVAVSGPPLFYELPINLSPKTIESIPKPYFRFLREVLGHEGLCGPNMALRKNAWNRIKKEICTDDRNVHEDIDLAIHIAHLGKIKFDSTFTVKSSFRRFKKFVPYMEYPYRIVNSIRSHEQFTVKAQSKRIVKKLVEKALKK